MGLVSNCKSIPKSISCSEVILGRSLGITSGNSLTMGTNSMGGFSESKYFTLTTCYKHPFEIILQALRQETIWPLGIEFPPFYSKIGSFGKLKLKILVLQSMKAKKLLNQSIPKMTSKSTISSCTYSTWVILLGNIIREFLYNLFETTDSPIRVVTMKNSFRISGKISNFLAIKGVTKDNIAPKSSKHRYQYWILVTYLPPHKQNSIFHP